MRGAFSSYFLSAKEGGVTDERDSVDKKVRDDQRPYPSSAVKIPAIEQPHDDVATPSRDSLVEVIGAAKQGRRR